MMFTLYFKMFIRLKHPRREVVMLSVHLKYVRLLLEFSFGRLSTLLNNLAFIQYV